MNHHDATQVDQLDRELEKKIRDALEHNGRVHLKQLRVDVINGVATVQGRVPSYYERQLCIRSCHKVSGIREVVDRIEVK
jgi:osmotically-inducible protein OsmY